MREIARVQRGLFPTQDRIVRAVARLFKPPISPASQLVVLDAGCGTDQALHDLREAWLAQRPELKIVLLGFESDKNRCQQATTLLASGKGEGTALWSAIEDATVDQPVSLLWFNPPYDRIRGAGRTEMALFNRVKEWPARGTGLLLMIVPDYVLADAEVGLAIAVERDYELLGLWRYPEPEVVIDRSGGYVPLDQVERGWSRNPTHPLSRPLLDAVTEFLSRMEADFMAEARSRATDSGVWDEKTTYFVVGKKR